jgi:hypothetical protein
MYIKYDPERKRAISQGNLWGGVLKHSVTTHGYCKSEVCVNNNYFKDLQ